MLIDITLKITPKMVADSYDNEKRVIAGHIGTHFDAMGKEFPLEFTERRGVVFDTRGICDRDITAGDIDMDLVGPDMFVAFCTGFIEEVEYGCKRYQTEHPQLAFDLVDKLIEKGASIIGVDFAGVRRGSEHTPIDQYCADKNVFIVENLCNLDAVLGEKRSALFTANTYPMNYAEMTGLPCRIIARV